jgi:DNA-binding IclR family transcriptional regulator
VFNDEQRVVAAVSITVPAQQVANEQADPVIQLVRDAAMQLTQRISHL